MRKTAGAKACCFILCMIITKKEREVITMQEQELKKLIADALESVHDITLLKMVLQFIIGLK